MHCMHHVIKHISFDHIFLFVSGNTNKSLRPKEGKKDRPINRRNDQLI